MADKDKNLALASKVLAAGFLVFGLFSFYSSAQYIEKGHTTILVAYCVLCGVFYITVRGWRIIPAALCAIALIFTLTFSNEKFSWRKAYVESRTPFLFEEYIKEYPSLEEHIFAKYLGTKNWVNFSKTCAERIMQGMKVPKICQSASLIKQEFGIDIKKEIKSHFNKMKKTAKRIDSGKMRTAKQYQKCIADKACAEVPMLPDGVDPESINPNSMDFIDTRKMFWSIVNDRNVTPAVCEYMKLCSIALKLSVLDKKRLNL